MKFKDEGTQIWWDNLPKDKRDAVIKAYKCYDEMRNTPLVDDLLIRCARAVDLEYERMQREA
jgi:hypothetical protein|nr:MAG TPA: hypothetical protein [Caudoviricetes sp.]